MTKAAVATNKVHFIMARSLKIPYHRLCSISATESEFELAKVQQFQIFKFHTIAKRVAWSRLQLALFALCSVRKHKLQL